MVRTIGRWGSGEVFGLLGDPPKFLRGSWQGIKITGTSNSEDTPLSVREGLVGLVIPTIFTKEQVESQINNKLEIPDGSRMAYMPDVIKVLEMNGKSSEAEALRKVAPHPLDMYAVEPEIYKLVDMSYAQDN